MGIHKASKAEINDVLFRIPINHYFSTRYTEMLVAEAYSLRYKRLKNLEFSIKNTWLYEEEKVNGQENKNPNKASADSSNQSTVDSKITAPSTNNKNSSDEDKTTAENESKSEPAITYEDFREESQSTLFRETND